MVPETSFGAVTKLYPLNGPQGPLGVAPHLLFKGGTAKGQESFFSPKTLVVKSATREQCRHVNSVVA